MTVTVRHAAADACKQCLCKQWAPLCVKELDDQANGGGVFLVPDAIGRIRIRRYGCICIAAIAIHLNSGNVVRGDGLS